MTTIAKKKAPTIPVRARLKVFNPIMNTVIAKSFDVYESEDSKFKGIELTLQDGSKTRIEDKWVHHVYSMSGSCVVHTIAPVQSAAHVGVYHGLMRIGNQVFVKFQIDGDARISYFMKSLTEVIRGD